MASNRGTAKVYIDGILKQQFSAYTPESRWQIARTWSVASGTHTIKVEVVGDGYVDLDAFEVDIAYAPVDVYDNPTSSYITYFGTGWTHSSSFPDAYNGTVSYSKTSQDGVSFTFEGDRVNYTYTKAYNRGKAAVTIDGIDKGYLDLYSSTIQWQQSESYTGLGSGIHTINISVSGKKNSSASDYYVDVDAFWTVRNWYAQAIKNGTFYGVWGIIETAHPVIRERGAPGRVPFSYASVNIVNGPEWVETGWTKSPASGCIPKFTWAIGPAGEANHIEDVLPTPGVAYQYIIDKISDGNWRLRILRTDGVVLKEQPIPNPGFNVGTQIQAVGEVHSPHKQQDMGVSGILSLKWMTSTSGVWRNWDGWSNGVINFPPYQVGGVPPDTGNNVQVSGNNGNPVPPDAPCP